MREAARAAVLQHFNGRTVAGAPISTRRALQAVWRKYPDGVSDDEIVDLIVEVAVAQGISVAFDAREP
jgi:predicted RNase H-like nuclease (RuvC/YqgF family)